MGALASIASRGRIAAALLSVAIATLLLSLAMYGLSRMTGLTANLFRFQDFPLLMLGVAVLLALALRARAMPALRLPPPRLSILLLVLAVLLFAWAGTWLVFGGLPLTRDEIMANFDAAFLAQGHLVSPVPAQWRPFAAALNPQFMLPIPPDVGWLSGYLPGNAALRAIALRTVGAEWTGPILSALAILAVYRIGRRLWPESAGPSLVAATLMATSAQFLIMGMTAYAMSAHLTFNLLWLWCFLRGDRRGDLGAIAFGFVATGLHQLIFHPLFVAPFLLQLWFAGQRWRAVAYVAAYAMIGLFWVSYWQIALSTVGAPDAQTSAHGIDNLLSRIVQLLASLDTNALEMMSFNLLRFMAWQNLVLLPLALLAWPVLRRGDGIARPLALGVLLTIAAMLVLMPWQGLGWGYRYLHGLIGSLCLLGGYGWVSAVEEGRKRDLVLAAGTAITLLAMLPIQLQFAHAQAAPRVRASALIARAEADVVIVVPASDLYDDQVRNAPDVSNRPVMLDLRRLTQAEIRHLCSRYRVALFDIRAGARVGFPTGVQASLLERSVAATRRVGCGTVLT
jgi:hypothetical protein